MRRKRTKRGDIQQINEGVYDFYEMYDTDKNNKTVDKIINYYLDKIVKYGNDSLTTKEYEIFNNAKKGILNLDNPVYKRNKVTNDIEYDNKGNPVRLNGDVLIPGVPFVTSKGRGKKKMETISGRCYWNVGENFKTFYVYGNDITNDNPYGLVIWKTVSSAGKEMGAFIVPKSLGNMSETELWKNLNNKFDKGIILDKETYLTFLEFDRLYHDSKKENLGKLVELYRELSTYPKK